MSTPQHKRSADVDMLSAIKKFKDLTTELTEREQQSDSDFSSKIKQFKVLLASTARYELPSDEDKRSARADFKSLIADFKTFKRMSGNDIIPVDKAVADICRRVHQRTSYYEFFHSSKLKQAGRGSVRAYWVLRYRPLKSFVWSEKKRDINVYFAVYMVFTEALGEVINEKLPNCAKQIKDKLVKKFASEYEDLYIRPFSECDISKEALMVLSDTLKVSIESMIEAEQLKDENERLKLELAKLKR